MFQLPPEVSPAAKLQFLFMQSSTARAIQVAARLNLADVIGDGSKTVDEIARECGAHAPSLYRMLRMLTMFGIFKEVEGKRFEMTPMGACLKTGKDTLKDLILWQDAITRAREELFHAVKTGEAAFNKIFGMHMYQWYETHPEDAEVFNRAMTAQAANNHRAIAEAYDFAPFSKVVDVGGGHGSLLTAILKANPKLKGAVIDRPIAAEGAKKRFEQEGLSGRAEAIPGDFFEGVPPGGDLYIMSHIIHNWDDERSLKILRNVRKQIPPHGRLVVAEMVIPPPNEFSMGKFVDVHMLIVCPGGLERTREEYAALFQQAGFRLNRVISTRMPTHAIEGIPE